jgi:hypothetical protein
MIMPAANNFYSVASLLSFVLFAAWTLYLCWRARSPILLLILAGGALCYLQEPIVDHLGAVWYPSINQVPVIFHAFNCFIPLWVLPGYGMFVGALSVVLYRKMIAGITVKQLWTFNFIIWAADIMLELPGLNLGTYVYFGHPAMMFFNFPMTWAMSNTCIDMIAVAILVGYKEFFTGWRMLLIPVVVTMANGAAQGATEYPVFLALNSNASYPEKLFAALCTLGMSLLVVHLIGVKLAIKKTVLAMNFQPAKEYGRAAHIG